MVTRHVPRDFVEFLKSLISEKVEYLVVGGYAVGYYGHPRVTDDLDLWIAMSARNADRIMNALEEFGFSQTGASKDLFLSKNQIIRMGVPPVRIELLTSIDGVDFDECYARREVGQLGGLTVDFISLSHLKQNKRASGRPKDLDDLTHL